MATSIVSNKDKKKNQENNRKNKLSSSQLFINLIIWKSKKNKFIAIAIIYISNIFINL